MEKYLIFLLGFQNLISTPPSGGGYTPSPAVHCRPPPMGGGVLCMYRCRPLAPPRYIPAMYRQCTAMYRLIHRLLTGYPQAAWDIIEELRAGSITTHPAPSSAMIPAPIMMDIRLPLYDGFT